MWSFSQSRSKLAWAWLRASPKSGSAAVKPRNFAAKSNKPVTLILDVIENRACRADAFTQLRTCAINLHADMRMAVFVEPGHKRTCGPFKCFLLLRCEYHVHFLNDLRQGFGQLVSDLQHFGPRVGFR